MRIIFYQMQLLTYILSLKPIDIVVLKKLSEVVNVVPVIAKSDSLTIDERQAFKLRVCIEYVCQICCRNNSPKYFIYY